MRGFKNSKVKIQKEKNWKEPDVVMRQVFFMNAFGVIHSSIG